MMPSHDDPDTDHGPIATDAALDHISGLWASLAENLDEHVRGQSPKTAAEAHELIKMAAQAEGCYWRATGEPDAFDIELPRRMMEVSSPIGVKVGERS